VSSDRDGEYAETLDLGVRWEPNVDQAVLLQRNGRAFLLLEPHFDDEDRRAVVFEWWPCEGALLGGPGDFGRNTHRLWPEGLSDCVWAAEVRSSEWVERIEARWNRRPASDGPWPSERPRLHHFILLLKDATFEVVAAGYSIHRVEGSRSSVLALLQAIE